MLLCCSLLGCGHRQFLAPIYDARGHRVHGWHPAYYRVVRGDTLYSIAFRYDEDYRRLAALNGMKAPYMVRVGQVIRLQAIQKPKRVQRSPKKTLQTNRPVTHYWGAKWIRPAPGRVVSGFAPSQGRKGIDIAGQKGQAVRAAASGVVAYAGHGIAGFGNLIIIKHDHQYLSAYGYNARNIVREGAKIKAGQVIAYMGMVDRRYWGVHFEIRRQGAPVNPLNYF